MTTDNSQLMSYDILTIIEYKHVDIITIIVKVELFSALVLLYRFDSYFFVLLII